MILTEINSLERTDLSEMWVTQKTDMQDRNANKSDLTNLPRINRKHNLKGSTNGSNFKGQIRQTKLLGEMTPPLHFLQIMKCRYNSLAWYAEVINH